MHVRTLVLFSLVMPVIAAADTPKLVAVDTQKQPLKLSAPAGWQVHTEPPRHRDLSTIAGISPECPNSDISVTIQLDQDMKSPEALLADQYKGVKPKMLHGWACIVSAVHTEVMCAGRLKGLSGIVSAYFATVDKDAFTRYGDPGEFTSQVAASMSWKGKLSDLTEWRREKTDEAKASCK